MFCAICTAPLPEQTGRGRPRCYCSEDCRRAAEGLAALARVLEARPVALVAALERIELADVNMARLTDDDVRRVRASAFTVASRGRRLKPGSSGRYTTRNAANTAT